MTLTREKGEEHCRLDYCNSLLAGLPTGQMSRLQSVLRAAARLVLGENFWLRVTTASAQGLRLSERFFHYYMNSYI